MLLMLRVLVFGNPLAKIDSAAVKIADKLSGKMAGIQKSRGSSASSTASQLRIEFVRFDTSEDLEKEGSELIIMDAVVGLEKPRLITLEELELSSNPVSMHGFDLLWSLLLLKKLGKVKKAVIVGVPAKKSVRESLPQVEKLLEKLLA